MLRLVDHRGLPSRIHSVATQNEDPPRPFEPLSGEATPHLARLVSAVTPPTAVPRPPPGPTSGSGSGSGPVVRLGSGCLPVRMVVFAFYTPSSTVVPH